MVAFITLISLWMTLRISVVRGQMLGYLKATNFGGRRCAQHLYNRWKTPNSPGETTAMPVDMRSLYVLFPASGQGPPVLGCR